MRMILEFTDVINSRVFWICVGVSMVSLIAVAISETRAEHQKPWPRIYIGAAQMRELFNPATMLSPAHYLKVMCVEPLSVIPFYAGAWYLIFGNLPKWFAWWLGAVIWRIICDSLICPRHANGDDGHLLTKLAWCTSAAVYFASLSYAFCGLFLLAGAAIGAVTASTARPIPRDRWRRRRF